MLELSPEFWSISFGNFLTLIAMIAGGVAVTYTIRGRVDGLSGRMLAVEEKMEKLVQVLVAQGRHEERMVAMQQQINAQGSRLDELISRFNHFINGRPSHEGL